MTMHRRSGATYTVACKEALAFSGHDTRHQCTGACEEKDCCLHGAPVHVRMFRSDMCMSVRILSDMHRRIGGRMLPTFFRTCTCTDLTPRLEQRPAQAHARELSFSHCGARPRFRTYATFPAPTHRSGAMSAPVAASSAAAPGGRRSSALWGDAPAAPRPAMELQRPAGLVSEPAASTPGAASDGEPAAACLAREDPRVGGSVGRGLLYMSLQSFRT